MMMTRRLLLAALAALIAVPAAGEDAQPRKLAVASISIIADLVRNVGGDRVEVKALVGPNGDAHVYSPTPGDAKEIAAAAIVFVNGLGLEGWLPRLVTASGTNAPVIVVTKGVPPRKMPDEEHPGRTVTDPHAWQSIADAKIYVANIRDGLVAVDPAGKAAYEANAQAYLAALDQVEGEVRTAIASIPPDMRLWWRYHTVQSGDTVASLARSFHTTAKQIEEANHLDGSVLDADQKLVIPVAPGRHPEIDTATYARRITRYKVRHGDTVESVAENFGVSPQMLRRWNGLRGSRLSGRRVLALHLPITPSHDADFTASRPKSKKTTQTASSKPPATKSAEIERIGPGAKAEKAEAIVVHHKVRTGETLYSIANYYKTTVAALKRDNRNIAVLRPGMILTIELAR